MSATPSATTAGTSGRSSVLYAFAIGLGIIIGTTGILVTQFQIIIIPIIAYISATGLNLLTQNAICTKSNTGQAFTLGSIAAVVSVITYLLASNVGLLGSPIRALFPNMDVFTQKRFIIGFYLFWAGLYSQIFTSGFVQACPS
jgi:hypothetical protein